MNNTQPTAPYTVNSFAQSIVQKYPTGTTADGTPYSKLSPQELTQKIVAKYPVYAKQISDYAPPATPKPIAETGKNYMANVAPAAQDVMGGGNIGAAVSDLGKGKIASGLEHASLGVASDAVQAIFAPLAAPLQTLLSHTADYNAKNPGIAGASIPNTPEAQASRQQLVDWAKQHPDIARTLSDAFNVGSSVIGTEGAGGVATKPVSELAAGAKETLGNVADKAGELISGTPEEQAARQAASQAADKAALATKVDSIAKVWEKPTTVPGNTFKNATAVLDKSPDTPKFLAEQKIDPFQHVQDGKYTTADTADALRETAGKMSGDTLRPSLHAADYSTPKTPVSDLTKSAIKNVGKEANITAGDKEAIIRNINKEAAALQRKYPNGMSLVDMHDEKITYAKNGGYSPIKSASDNNLATANRNFSSALGDAVEAKAPKNIPVQELNAYFSKYYKAADYLDALNGKKAPVGLLSNIAHRGAQVVGAAVGHGVGGGILGGVGGYMIGGALEHALENLTGPMKASFLRNLETTNPEAFTKVQEYLRNASTGGGNQLRLPPAGPESPIPLGAKTTPEPSVAPYAAKTPLPTANPKTGRMQTTYLSTPK